jgi:Cu2+-exporting ATPase/Cu+-exporting ATPase
MKTIQLGVEGMTCQHCVHHVTEALREVPGVSEVSVSLQEKAATLSVEEGFSPEQAATALDEAGYKLAGVQGA